MDWETHCEDCGLPLVDDPDWQDERHCYPCNVVYLHPTTAAEIERRLAEDEGQRYTLDELAKHLE